MSFMGRYEGSADERGTSGEIHDVSLEWLSQIPYWLIGFSSSPKDPNSDLWWWVSLSVDFD